MSVVRSWEAVAAKTGRIGPDGPEQAGIEDARLVIGVEEDSYCFLCGIPLGSLPFVMWMGNHPRSGESLPIGFHPRCAVSFNLRLGRDCWEVAGLERLLDEP